MSNKFILLFAVLLFISCRDTECEELTLALQSLNCEEVECLIDLRELFREDWSELYFFQGFNTPADITQVIGFEYKGKPIYDHTKLILQISGGILKETRTDCIALNMDRVISQGHFKVTEVNTKVLVSKSEEGVYRMYR